MGHPWRIRHLDEVLGHVCARQGVWKATGREVIDWFQGAARNQQFESGLLQQRVNDEPCRHNVGGR
jgi:hypothetical protein